jgi:hypothetical protein
VLVHHTLQHDTNVTCPAFHVDSRFIAPFFFALYHPAMYWPWQSCRAAGLGCPSKLVSIRNNRNWNRNQVRHYPKQNVCFGCFDSIPKQRDSVFQLNRNKQKINRNTNIFIKGICGFLCSSPGRTTGLLYCSPIGRITRQPRIKQK